MIAELAPTRVPATAPLPGNALAVPG